MRNSRAGARIAGILLIPILMSCNGGDPPPPAGDRVITPDRRIDLLQGEGFNGWERFIGGDNARIDDVWQIRDSILHCTGVPTGYIRTVDKYADYRLHLEWRWVEEPGNSGVLLHTQLPDTIWPKCIEAQLKAGDAGDIILLGGTGINEQTEETGRRIPKRAESSENEPGEWNRYRITCKNDSLILDVNGIRQNIATGASVRSGRICLQSEGKPIQFRRIYLDPLK